MATTKKPATKKPVMKKETKVVADTVTISLPKELFAVSASDKLLAQYVRVYLNNLKPTTAYSKTRGEVSGTTKKIYKQKGTGRARHGSAKAPIFVGGGTAHGAKNEVVKLKMTKKMRRKALFLTLTMKAKSKSVYVLADKGFSDETKTQAQQKILAATLPQSKKSPKVLVVFPHDAAGKKAASNLERVSAAEACNLNAYLVMNNEQLVVTEKALTEMVERFVPVKK